jgi:hypothetical protein
MSDTKLVIPYDVEGVLIDVLGRRHPEHLAKEERLRGLDPRTFETFATMVRMADAAGLRLGGDTTPALLLGTIGAPTFVRNEDENIDAVYQLGMQVTVMGQRRRDTLFKRDVMAWTIAECMYQRIPRGSNALINSVRLVDYEPLAEVETQRTVGDARMVWEIGVKDVLSITGFLPSDGSTWPPEAGGAPAAPYDPVPDRPIVTDLTFEIDRNPIVE